MEWYRDDIKESLERDPFPKLKQLLISNGFEENQLNKTEKDIQESIKKEFKRALEAKDPKEISSSVSSSRLVYKKASPRELVYNEGYHQCAEEIPTVWL